MCRSVACECVGDQFAGRPSSVWAYGVGGPTCETRLTLHPLLHILTLKQRLCRTFSTTTLRLRYIHSVMHLDQCLLLMLLLQVPIKVVQGKLCVRASAHVYNKLADYQVLADAVLSIYAV